MENNNSTFNIGSSNSQVRATQEYFLGSKFIKSKSSQPNQNLFKRASSTISSKDQYFCQKQLKLNFNKKKQLRSDSANNLKITHRSRSISSFTNTTNQHKIPLHQRQLNQNFSSINFLHFRKQQIKGYSRQNNEKKLQFKKCSKNRKDSLPDWGNRNKKKIRRLTGLTDYGTMDFSSTFNAKKEQIVQLPSKPNSIQFKNNLKKDRTNQNKLENQKANEKEKRMEIFKQIKISDFEKGKKLGAGNFSEAFLARHKKTGFLCALKVMQKDKIKQDGYQQQIIREITIQSYLRHENIVQLYGVFEDEQKIYLIMQYCIEGQLYGKIRKNNRLQVEKTAQIISGIAKGLQFLHSQLVIHRDLKPENIFINFEVAKIGDLGWAVYKGRSQQLRKTTSGSPLYYSPQIIQKQEYNQKIDIWGLGTIAYECLIGMVPFKVYSLFNLDRIITDQIRFPTYVQVNQEAKDFIEKCLKKKADNQSSIYQGIYKKDLRAEIQQKLDILVQFAQKVRVD